MPSGPGGPGTGSLPVPMMYPPPLPVGMQYSQPSPGTVADFYSMGYPMPGLLPQHPAAAMGGYYLPGPVPGDGSIGGGGGGAPGGGGLSASAGLGAAGVLVTGVFPSPGPLPPLTMMNLLAAAASGSSASGGGEGSRGGGGQLGGGPVGAASGGSLKSMARAVTASRVRARACCTARASVLSSI
jgi:hypothetical protein